MFQIHSTTLYPPAEAYCKKCGGGGNSWMEEADPLTWYCPYCGNRLYFVYGGFRQQIEVIMQSHRKEDYVKLGGCFVPKVNDNVRTIRLQRKALMEAERRRANDRKQPVSNE